MAKNTLDIIVAGAGIGGLGVALALQQAGHRVRLFERTRALRPVGAAISVWPNGVKVLRALGVGAPLDAAAGKMDRMSYHDRDGGLMARFSLQPLYDKVQERAKPIARMALQQLLLDAVGAHHVQLGATCERYEQDGAGVTVHLTNGSTHRADLFVVSDGSRSRLRDQVAGQVISRRYRGYVNWNGRIRIAPELGVADEWTQFVGDHRRVSLMPMGGDAFYFFFDVPLSDPSVLGIEMERRQIAPDGTASLAGEAAFPKQVDPERHRRVLCDHFDGWAPPVRYLIERMDPAVIANVAIHDTDPVPRLADRRVVMIGDAAHAMAPDLGQGGCQALEDAWVLARALDGEHVGDIVAALRHYEQQRLPRVHDIVERARKRAAVIHGDDPVQTQAWYDALRAETGADVIAGLHKTIDGGPIR
ncbi:FAD-dependent monooxygenase [Robbsia andropogonis]|uniref:FAD-dependent monooxygenase n=2 Tax=Robbsia andropogonis TaxID=28092 RepID=UPI0004B8EA8F|nr:FAD-dependent monooxygenase [Robbsia andropogonis]MCP1118067.1 FAD-dependent monooxygenase [Robbsia andropogonis]MCP1127652.1 FAD-dependent monooxygenase [Robbsia andropogonis]